MWHLGRGYEKEARGNVPWRDAVRCRLGGGGESRCWRRAVRVVEEGSTRGQMHLKAVSAVAPDLRSQWALGWDGGPMVSDGGRGGGGGESGGSWIGWCVEAPDLCAPVLDDVPAVEDLRIAQHSIA